MLFRSGPLTPYADEVRAVARACGVADRVDIRGYIDGPALLELYRRARLFIFPSRYEGFGLPPLQALACGLPVVAARIPVLAEVLGECALYATPGDPSDFAAACMAALQSPDVAERVERGRARARAFTWAAVADRMTGVYRKLV